MEKRTKTYDLEAIKRAFSLGNQLRVTNVALQGARAMGFSRDDIVDVIQQIKKRDFIKSMTTYADHRIWRDVYNVEFNNYVLYIKFQADESGYLIVSFKEK